MTGNKITAEFIQKYLNGTCTLEEKARVILWYNSFDQQEDILGQLSLKEREQLKLSMLDNINSRIDSISPAKENTTSVRTLTYWISGIAAALLMFLGITFYQNQEAPVIANQNIKEAKVLVLENQGTTLYKRELEDGTVIWLNPGARIEVPEHFAANKREVSMTGKVFFEVSKNPKRPFLIYAGGVTTKVLGTSFLIKAEKGKDTEVEVLTGKVAVAVSDKENDKGVMLLPEQRAVYSTEEQSLKKDITSAQSEVKIWKRPRLSFENTQIREVLSVLEDNFDITINSNAKINSCILKADFTDQNLAEILEMLCKSVDASYQINQEVVTINGKGCN
ncbi:FecR family protein [Desertivirga xinjiangensis]|uniref:FecR family protein n=1 Tax=Desertivirga xinjiangensis TaxID=539206 RepID=UPI00210DA515|nr:FecR family protein [Pedobacter xinjiangensis]